MRALVTGGAGFIGSHLVDELVARDHAVLVVDDLSTGHRKQVHPRAAFRHASVLDRDSVSAAFRAHAPDTVFHLAADIDVRRSVADPARDARVNVEGTINVLEAARAAHVRRFVLSSTGGAIYGNADRVPTGEDAPLAPLAPYGASKVAGEHYAALYDRLHGLSTMALRYANVYGPRQDPLGEGGVVAIFTELARRGGRATVFGDGEQTRDFVYVGDVVAANLAAAAAESGGPVNIGRGEETSVLALAERLGLEVDHAPGRPGEVRRSCLDPARALALLDWRAQVDVATGVARTLAAA